MPTERRTGGAAVEAQQPAERRAVLVEDDQSRLGLAVEQFDRLRDRHVRRGGHGVGVGVGRRLLVVSGALRHGVSLDRAGKRSVVAREEHRPDARVLERLRTSATSAAPGIVFGREIITSPTVRTAASSLAMRPVRAMDRNVRRSTIARMDDVAAIVLAGGRSSRMGSPKAALDWHGSTLLRRVTGILARAVAPGPVVVVSAPGQSLPELDAAVEVVADEQEGRGPLQGLAAGLAAIGDRAPIAYVSSTDVPLLHPAFVRRVLGALDDGADVALPDVGGYRQPLSAAYRVAVRSTVEELIAADRMRPAFLFERARVCHLERERAARRTPALARLDPELSSVSNLNEPADYERAVALPAPEIVVERFGPLATAEPGLRRQKIRAWSLGEAADAAGFSLGEHVVAALNGDQISRNREVPLVAGDTIAFMVADAGG